MRYDYIRSDGKTFSQETTLVKDENGKFPAYAWPGGYPIFYLCKDGGVLCPACANGENGSEASETADTPADWRLAGSDIHWEGQPLMCDHCNRQIESAYGDPDEQQ